MRLKLPSLPPTICLNDLGSVQRDALEGIDSYQHNTTVCIYTVQSIAIPDRVQHLKAKHDDHLSSAKANGTSKPARVECQLRKDHYRHKGWSRCG